MNLLTLSDKILMLGGLIMAVGIVANSASKMIGMLLIIVGFSVFVGGASGIIEDWFT